MFFPYSQLIQAVMVPNRQFAHLWLGQWTLLSQWGRAPGQFAWEQKALISGAQDVATVTSYESYLQLRGHAVEVLDDDSAELRAVRRDLDRGFLPGRSFSSPADFNTQLNYWLTEASMGGRLTQNRLWAAELKGMQLPGRYEIQRSMLDKPYVASVKTVASEEGFVHCGDNAYMVGRWGHGRRLAVETTLDTVVISSAGYHSGGFHQVEYERAWTQNMTIDQPVRHLRTLHGRREQVEGP
ncbi:hypothetical protein ACFRFL_40130 [Streptomyces sp. NPDC056708]|uniref:hypothetical protein n=1 Tax=unclassified Streptomyces TaxID=2593676 RepID=UPI0036A99A6B